jgi:hypothetical protein
VEGLTDLGDVICDKPNKKNKRNSELNMLTFGCICLYKVVQLTSRLEHTGTWSAAAHRSRRLCYRSAVFFHYLLSYCAPHSPERKDSVLLKKYFAVLKVFKNCVNGNIFVTWNFRKSGECLYQVTRSISVRTDCTQALSYFRVCWIPAFSKRRGSLKFPDDPVEIRKMFWVLFFSLCLFFGGLIFLCKKMHQQV